MIMLECRRVYFSGRVQGVGFRLSVAELARGLALSGQVRNLPDGRVEMLVQGTATDRQRLIDLLKQRYAGYIVGVTEEGAPAIEATGRIDIVR
jgi:acylphosphatase